MIASFDVETTGTSPETDELLQITIVDENKDILFESYVHPKTRTSWRSAELVNHITPDMVKDAPSAESLRDELQSIFDKADVITGYNVGFDINFVTKDCGVVFDKSKVIDCLKVFKEECTKEKLILPHHKLGDAIDYYCPEAKAAYLKNAHDASCDAIATVCVYLAQIDKDRPRFYNPPEIKEETKVFLDKFFEATLPPEPSQEQTNSQGEIELYEI